MKLRLLAIIACIITVTINTESVAQYKETGKMCLKKEPVQVGESIASNLIDRRFGWRYQKVCSYYGALIFADATHNKDILHNIEAGYAPFLSGKRKPRSGHVDFNVFGIWPLEMYRQTGKEEYLRQGKALADDEYKNQRQDGLTALTRFWIDDMYMVGSLQVQAYKSLQDKIYLDRAALQLVAYIDSLQKPNGLFFHREDAPFYWGRGNGWAASAMTEILQVLPKEHSKYPELVGAYKKMMDALKQYQGKSCMWHQLIDEPESFAEPSCTGMFLYAMATGVDLGILSEETYLPVIEKAWNELAVNFVNKKGEVKDVCMWTNAKKRKSYYLRRPKITGDYHGQAATLWAATAILKLQQSQK